MQKHKAVTKAVIQGTYEVSASAGTVLTTVLGSCVAVCLYDRAAQIGGMNHFLLPKTSSTTDSCGLHMMELLINGLLGQGAERRRLQAKLFGGANMIDGLTDIGAENAEFARNFLQYETIPITSESLGGNKARRVRFWPTTGLARQKLMSASPIVRAEHEIFMAKPKAVIETFDLELF